MDDAALQRTYETYGYLIHRRCGAILQNAADADDALQEVFLRMQRSELPHNPEAILSWLYTIAFRVCADLARRTRRERLPGSDELAALDARSEGSAEDADRRAVVGAALRQVDTRTREIAVLHHVGGLTQEEVAQRSGYSRRTVGKKLQHFAAQLRLTLQLSGGPPR